MKVIDLTLDELKNVIREIVDEKFREIFPDPDHGLELRDEFEERLADSLTSEGRIPLDEVKRRLGMNGL